MSKLTVFLGGTCGNSTWRDDLMKNLNDSVDAFNPVVPNWTPECQAEEDRHKQKDNIVLYVITPETKSPYSISEVTRSSITQPQRTMICVLPEANGCTFEAHEAKAWTKILKDCSKDGATICSSLEDVAEKLNQIGLAKTGAYEGPQPGEE